MTEKNKYRIINIRRYIGNENPELGEDELREFMRFREKKAKEKLNASNG